MTTITNLNDFKALEPFFHIIAKGLKGIADGAHFFDLLAEHAVFDYIITVPDYPRRVNGRKAVAELYSPNGTMIVLDRCHDLSVHHDTKTGVVVLEYASEAASFQPGSRTPTGTSRYSSPIARSLAGATTSTPWRSSTRWDGRHVDGAFSPARHRRLVRRGLLQRRRRRDDARVYSVQLTDMGERTLASTEAAASAAEAQLLSCLSTKQRQALIEALTILADGARAGDHASARSAA